jgi:two-component system, NtrC family, sensor kinase
LASDRRGFAERERTLDLEVEVLADTAGFAHPEFLVETEWLKAHLGDSDLRILDCTVHIVFDPQAMFTIAPGRDDFERGHIPRAQFVDLTTQLSDTSHPVPLMAPSPSQFASVMGRLGVENGCRVILYSAQNAYWATRVWWLFRVFGCDNAALLNGGWQRWRREGRPIETGPARQPPPARFNISELRPLMASKADVLAAIADPAVCIINALPEDQFLFTSGVHYGRPGHITGSLNVPSENLLHSETNEFLPAAELRRRFERVGAFERPVITYCGGAIAASADAMALVMLGHPDVKLYDGSLLEWAADPSLPMEVDPIPTSSTQALAGIDNKRFLSELREALDRQTATTEVLQIINRSPGHLAPVFEAILERALRLCEADFGVFWAFDGRQFRAASCRGMASELAEVVSRGPYAAHLNSLHARAIAGEPLVHIADISGEGLYQSGIDPLHRALVDLGGARTVLAIPLRRDASLLGILTLCRREVRLFADKHIVLLQSFAEQALIAMENARLLNEVRQRQEELRITFENMGDGVAMFDETPRLVAWNRKFQDILDLPDGVLAEHLTFAEYIRYLAQRGEYGAEADPEEQIHRLTENIEQYRAFERVRPDGRVIEIRHNPVPGGGFVLIYADITERKRNEVEIRAARDAAEAAYRDLKAAQANLIQTEKMASLGQLTAGIAHEIKNPLNFVNNFAGLSVELLNELKETAAPGFAMLDEAKRSEIDDLTRTLSGNLEKINEHGNRADAIVRSMLEHSRGSSGERRSVNLNTLVDEAMNLAYHGARAQDQSFKITLQRDFGEGIAPITLVPQDVTRVLLNLFSNGFYAVRRRQSMEPTPGFEPTLKVVTRDLGGAVEIRVRDNGIGVPEEVKDKLFQPFFTTKPTGEGTGLGLSISYDIVTQQHGGSITVDSMAGEYSEFTIRIPRNA